MCITLIFLLHVFFTFIVVFTYYVVAEDQKTIIIHLFIVFYGKSCRRENCDDKIRMIHFMKSVLNWNVIIYI